MATPRKTTRAEKRNQSQKRALIEVMDIEPKTDAQADMIEDYQNGYHVAGIGSAGTGKSFIALWLALQDVINSRKSKIIIVRSTVPTREVGHLPGELSEKIAVYEAPYRDIINTLCQRGDAYEFLKKHDKIEFMSTSFVRGMTFDNAVIVVDEFQSMHQEELYSVLTRVGENTQTIVIGDTRQCDLNPRKEVSCFSWFVGLVNKMPKHFSKVEFMPEDIVRSGFTKALILANER